MKTLKLQTTSRVEMVDMTEPIRRVVRESGVMSGLCFVFCPHTTGAVTLNENTDPDVRTDFDRALAAAVPRQGPYVHSEGNSDAHVKASLIGSSVTMLVENGKLVLGQWQAVYFCEFDGPRSRTLVVKVLG
ncbi:MAG TPA: secondary thiamine-phosphate synthase enzyme YjbQ [Thermodesulfobacteriota bacterium]